MRILIFITFIFLNIRFSQAQIQGPMSFQQQILTHCQCKQYNIQPPNLSMNMQFKTDSAGRVIVATEYMLKDSEGGPTFLDSMFYNDKHQIVEMRSYSFYQGMSNPPFIHRYTYLESGQLFSNKEFLKGKIHYSEEYRRDAKGRPLLFMKAYYKEDGSIDTEDKITFTFTNDTIALLTYTSNEKFIAKAKHVYNRKYQLLDELIENPATGKKVHFVWKYNSKGQVLSIHKEKVVVGDVFWFWSDHYLSLLDASRKIKYTYDTKGRLLSKQIYMNIALDKMIEYRYTYIE